MRAERGIIIADTKFEFAQGPDGKLVLIDEVLTPDSSRFWPADTWKEGTSPPSFDKQFVRDYLETLDWNKTAPGPKLPPEVIAGTRAKYLEALTVNRFPGLRPLYARSPALSSDPRCECSGWRRGRRSAPQAPAAG